MAHVEKLWEEYKKQISSNKKIVDYDLEKQFSQYSTLIKETEKVYSRLQTTIQNIPIGVALRYWLDSSSCQTNKKQYSCQILTLIEKKILPVKNEQNQPWTLGDLQEQGEQGHRRVIEEIRSSQEWKPPLKEELVNCYIEFSDHLNKNTLGIIPKAHDPDRFHASHKIINYDNFMEFVQFLSERDALIAKLLYFGAPTVDEVLLLTYEQLDFDNCSINFLKKSVSYPKHVMVELLNFVGKKKKKDFVFLNYKGNQVVRTHLNHSFGRASKEIKLVITPRDLIKLKLK